MGVDAESMARRGVAVYWQFPHGKPLRVVWGEGPQARHSALLSAGQVAEVEGMRG